MKFTFLLLTLTLISSQVYAAEPATPEPLLVRSHVTGDELRLTLANLEGQTTKVALENLATKRTHFTRSVRKHNGHAVKLSLAQLPDGRYLLSIQKGETFRRQVILVTDGRVAVSAWK